MAAGHESENALCNVYLHLNNSRSTPTWENLILEHLPQRARRTFTGGEPYPRWGEGGGGVCITANIKRFRPPNSEMTGWKVWINDDTKINGFDAFPLQSLWNDSYLTWASSNGIRSCSLSKSNASCLKLFISVSLSPASSFSFPLRRSDSSSWANNSLSRCCNSYKHLN